MPLSFMRHGQRDGSQIPVVVIHGATMSKEAWAPVLALLGTTDVIAVDLPGHGDSTAIHADSVDGILAHVTALLSTLGITRAVWAGHSLGGLVCQSAVATHPALVAGLVLIGTSARFKIAPGLVDMAAADFDAAVTTMLASSFGPNAPAAALPVAEASMRIAGIRGFADAFMAVAAFDGRPTLPGIAVPTIVVSGALDLLAPMVVGERLAAGITGSELRVMAEAGHMLLAEAPEDVARAIRDVQRQCA